jgi:microsomal dipeptidase-like Zn-dependent dipeptidase
MAFYDLHCHPSLKSAMIAPPKQSPVVFIEPNILGLSQPLSDLLKTLVGQSLNSQCSFGQIEGGSLVVVALIAFEKAYTKVKLGRKKLLKAIDNFDTELYQDLTAIPATKSYFDLFKANEVAHLLGFEGVAFDGKQYKILWSINDYPNSPDPDTVYVVVSVEGGHNFYTNPDIVQQEVDPESILDNLEHWKTNSKAKDPLFPRIFYITPTHHAQNVLVNHAWALPAGFVNNEITNLRVGSFCPTHKGISDSGEKFIKIALKQNATQDRILIDVKHMSLGARKQFYGLLKENFPDAPIIASHVGMVGRSWTEWPVDDVILDQSPVGTKAVQYNIRGGFLIDESSNKYIYFNPWSINLYNEDILEIIASKGLIGIELDERVIGIENNQIEYFSKRDLPDEWQNGQPINRLYPSEVLDIDIDIDADEGMLYFCQQVIHIVLVVSNAKRNGNNHFDGIDVWNHICLGSDFDGFITPIQTTKDATALQALFNNTLFQTLNKMAVLLNTTLGYSITVPDDIVDKLRFNNGFAFMRQHFV